MSWRTALSESLSVFFLSVCAHGAFQDASVILSERVQKSDKGRHVIQDALFETQTGGYTVRYEYIERGDAPGRIDFPKWAPTIGYVPVGIAAPSMANWYNQGFFRWTFDGFNINDYKAEVRIVREFGRDAMVEYVWDTPKVKATARFAVTSRSDKLLFFGRYEPKETIRQVKLCLMAYPATFEKPWNRRVTSKVRTLKKGAIRIDLSRERWLLFEDVRLGRKGAGSAGLLLGDASAYARVTVSAIGGYAEYTDIILNPDRRVFALGLYEFPSMPDYESTRDYFRRNADAESDALAAFVDADWDKPLAPLPVDAEREARIRAAGQASLTRPAEYWNVNPAPLDFPWAAQLPGAPVRAALLVPRWSAYDTMEFARRLELDVRHQYFDTDGAIASPRSWPYRRQTGIGPLKSSLALRNAVRICVDETTEVIVAAKLKSDALGVRLQQAIKAQVKDGKGLVITGGADAAAGWPDEMFAQKDPELAERVLSFLPWNRIAGLRKGGRGRLSDDPPLTVYRYGDGRILVFQAKIARYCALLPLNSLKVGLGGADDRLLALHGMIWAAAAGKTLPARITFGGSQVSLPAGKAGELPVDFSGAEWKRALVRIQDDNDKVYTLSDDLIDETGTKLRIPPLPAMHRCYVDMIALNEADECVGLGGTVLEVVPKYKITSLTLSPAQQNHKDAPLMVHLPGGGRITVQGVVKPAPKDVTLQAVCRIRDCVDRVVARSNASVASDGQIKVALGFPRPVVVPHCLEIELRTDDRLLATTRLPFTAYLPFPYNDFTVLMWSYAGGDITLRTENRLCYQMGSDMMDICHMGGYSEAGAAREYALAAESGQRMVPYVTRIAGTSREDHTLAMSLLNKSWIEKVRVSLERTCRQAAPYHPPAYTLGDENYLARSGTEVDLSPETVAAFNRWLRKKYQYIAALNDAWKTNYHSFDAVTEPMLLDKAVQQTMSFAPWFDFRIFMDTAFADVHDTFAAFVRGQDPGAKVGWDGFLNYHWLAGYDFYKLTRNLELNQVYTVHPLQGELVRSFKRPDALTGEWGNAVADNEAGFSAICWHNLFRGHNSCWWWTSWGCDYIPFNPDMSVSAMGKWFFESAAEVKAGPGRLLLHARRDDSAVAVLYNQADLYASKLQKTMAPKASAPDWRADLLGVIHALEDAGCQYSFVAAADLQADPNRLTGFRVLVLPLSVCMSDALVKTVCAFVRKGGVVIADGRPAMLTGNGLVRKDRLLDNVFGVELSAGLDAFRNVSASATIELGGERIAVFPTETGLTITGGKPMSDAAGVPFLITNQFGKGHAVFLNLPFSTVTEMRGDGREHVFLERFTQFLAMGDVKPYARLKAEGKPARCIEQMLFVDGGVRYLCLQQDILCKSLTPQRLTITIDAPAYVYDIRKRRAVSEERTKKWKATISRGYPLLFALVPYRVAGVAGETARECPQGGTLEVDVTVKAEAARAQYHVVRLEVFAPGGDNPHRQYSCNIACPNGRGAASIPFALNDPAGLWRLVFRDVAGGVKAEASVMLTSP